MKLFRYLVIPMLTVCLGVSCNDDDKNDSVNSLNVVPDSKIDFSATGNQDVTLTVKTTASGYTITPSPADWLIIGQSDDKETVTVNVKDNESGSPVNGSLKFSAEGADDVIITVTQSAAGNGGGENGDGYEGYQLVWSDEFNGNELDMSVWNIQIDGGGGGNNELEYYRAENLAVGVEPASGKNCLIITAKKENFAGRTCTSGRINSSGKKAFKYGRIEASVKAPKTANGLWPAFWMMGDDYDQIGWPKSGEIDILEMGHLNGWSAGNGESHVIGAAHWGYYKGSAYPNHSDSRVAPYSLQDGDFHLFTLIWDETKMAMYYDLDKDPDREPYFEMGITDVSDDWGTGYYFHKEFHILFNLAVGGNFTGIWDINQITALADGEAKMYVDYVRVYQKTN